MEGSGCSLGENGINPCIWAYLGSARAGEFPTPCSPAAHGRYSRVQQTAAGRLGEKRGDAVRSQGAKPACLPPQPDGPKASGKNV